METTTAVTTDYGSFGIMPILVILALATFRTWPAVDRR